MKQQILHNTSDVAKLLDCSPETVRRAVRAGRLKPINLTKRGGGECWRFKTEDIVSLPRKGEYHTIGSAYKTLRDAGVLPDADAKHGRYLVARLIKNQQLPATQSKLSGYWLIFKEDLIRFIRKSYQDKKGGDHHD